jgi:hypothetical protein
LRPKGSPKTLGSGRKLGVPNKATSNVKKIARKHAPEVMAELARLATHAESESARIAAGKEILDRAYGKAPAGDNFTFVEALKNLDKLSDFQLAEIVKIQRQIIASLRDTC